MPSTKERESTPPPPSIVRTVIALVSSAILLFAIYELRHAWLLIYVAIVLAVMFDPAVRLAQKIRIRQWRPGRGLSVAIVSLSVLAIVAAILLLIVPPIVRDAGEMQQRWPAESQRMLDWVHRHLPFGQSVTVDSIKVWFRRWAGGSPVQTVGTSLMDVLTTALILVYLLVDGRQSFDWGLSLLPPRVRPAARDVLTRGAGRMQRWVGGQGLLMLTHGGSAFLTFWLLGLPFFVALAAFAALVNIIPFLGPLLTLLAAGLVVATAAPGKLLGVVIFYLAYHNVESLFLQPRIMSHAVGVPGLTVIISLVIGYEVAGVVGMVVSVPTAVLLAEVRASLPVP